MKVLFLGSENQECQELLSFLKKEEGDVAFLTEKATPEMVTTLSPDIIVSYNYRFILRKEVFSLPRLGTVNLHISFLPWNRGADPNFWSHLEGTPSGVTVHYIDGGVDTGDIIGQEKVAFGEDETLKTSYEKLHVVIRGLFQRLWPGMRSGTAPRIVQKGSGTAHRLQDKTRFASLLSKKGYDTPIRELAAYAVRHEEAHTDATL